MSSQTVGVKSATHGVYSIEGNLSFTYSESGTTVGNRADVEIYETGKKLVSVDVSGSLSGITSSSYHGISKGVVDTLVLVLEQPSPATVDQTITVSNCMFTGDDATTNHSSEASATANWEAYSSDGTTSPIAFS